MDFHGIELTLTAFLERLSRNRSTIDNAYPQFADAILATARFDMHVLPLTGRVRIRTGSRPI